jgi:beta-glucosidase
VAQAPLNHDRLPGEPYDPRYAFGHGLSYTKFAYSGFGAEGRSVTLTVANKGKRAGKHTVLVFASKPGDPNYPASRLVAYRKLWLDAGDRRRVQLHAQLGPGRYVLQAGKEVTSVRIR